MHGSFLEICNHTLEVDKENLGYIQGMFGNGVLFVEVIHIIIFHFFKFRFCKFNLF